MIDLNNFLTTLPHTPGVYQMLDAKGTTLYVGKARNIKKRVSSYFRGTPDPKTQLFLNQLADISITLTETETDALLLESNLIKRLKPRYNILLRDDKSYPYIYIAAHAFPRMDLVRKRSIDKSGRFFGPYPNGAAARNSLRLLQKTFLLRQCRDSFFQSRTRPCLQYQIKRCTAPCVGLINAEQYNKDVNHAILFLEGKNDEVMHELTEKMDRAAVDQNYERAAHYRDQIAQLRIVQAQQYITRGTSSEDVVVVIAQQGSICVELLLIRQGQILGSRSFFPKISPLDTCEEVLMAFIGQHYLTKADIKPPQQIITNIFLAEKELIEAALTHHAQLRVRVRTTVRGERLRWLNMAMRNAESALAQRLHSVATLAARFAALQEDLGLPSLTLRIECFDVSHTLGEATVASCVVFGPAGPIKNDYRRYNITGITPGDDYAALQQVLLRRYTRIKTSEGTLPDMIVIDGGRGQLRIAKEVLEEVQLTDITLLAMSKDT
ncbi:MAG TPA: excinuclease ABC subunit UvrC, partial [Gammaproteobacteria bacterium]|nr:excinuclease ABC subunit UvrC [Gammaproteobacteria bacterium]